MALRLKRFSRSADHTHRADRSQDTGSDAAAIGNGRSNRAWIMLALVLGVAAVALVVVDRSAGPPVATLPTPLLEGEPDVYMEGTLITQYREDGTIEYRLEAERAQHFQGEALTRLDAPRLTLFRDGAEPWNVSARHGTLRRPPGDADAEIVSLEGDVVLEQTEADGAQLRLMTEVLQLYPRRQYAETDRDVMIESLFGRTSANGLAGDLQRGVLELLSTRTGPVQTILQPEHFK